MMQIFFVCVCTCLFCS